MTDMNTYCKTFDWKKKKAEKSDKRKLTSEIFSSLHSALYKSI